MFDKELLNEIASILKNKKCSVAVAESVTSGLLQAAFSNAEGASFIFQGGITAYNIGQKSRHLLVEPLHAIECNCVSEKIAQQMSKHVCSMFLSDYGIGTTGYAATIPEKNINELFAYYSICHNNEIIDSGIIKTDKEQGFPAQFYYTQTVLEKFKNCLNKK
ncbi:MAG: CinA family protein [Parafilimonas sp.]|nr:CinA family protein [Parafilimonas sp.]